MLCVCTHNDTPYYLNRLVVLFHLTIPSYDVTTVLIAFFSSFFFAGTAVQQYYSGHAADIIAASTDTTLDAARPSASPRCPPGGREVLMLS